MDQKPFVISSEIQITDFLETEEKNIKIEKEVAEEEVNFFINDHNSRKSNHFCKCKKEEKISASNYCEKCSEAFCNDCTIAHERLSYLIGNHTLKSI